MTAALPRFPSLLVIGAMWRRSLNEVLRVRGALLPATIAPVVFLLGMSGQFARLTGLEGFPTDSYLSWVVPLSCLQGAGFAGAATGANLARDIEQGLFDRFLVAPVSRPLLLIGPILGAVTRSLVPATVVLLVGLLLGAELSGGVLGLLALYVAAAAFCAFAGLWGVSMAVTFKTQQAGPLMQQGVFLGVFLSTAYTPEALLSGWLAEVAHYNPVTLHPRDGPAGDGGGDRAELGAHVPGAGRAGSGWGCFSGRCAWWGFGGWGGSGRSPRRVRVAGVADRDRSSYEEVGRATRSAWRRPAGRSDAARRGRGGRCNPHLT